MLPAKGGVHFEASETQTLSIKGHFSAVTDTEVAFMTSDKPVHSSVSHSWRLESPLLYLIIKLLSLRESIPRSPVASRMNVGDYLKSLS